MQLVRELYTADLRPWIVAFSGGKDSTAVLQLIWLSLEGLPKTALNKPVYVCYVDTGMEHPAYDKVVRSTMVEIQRAALSASLPFHVRLLEPELKHRYFVCVIGRGYAPPTHWFRWCTRNLRVRPMSAFIRSHVSDSGRVIVAMGLRESESQARSKTLAKYQNGEGHLTGDYGGVRAATAFTPIRDFRSEHVWQFLMQTTCPWGGSNRTLVQLYANAAGGECASYDLRGTLAPSCGGSRFGCWTCTVVHTDRSGSALAESDNSYRALSEFRDWLLSVRSDPSRRWKKRRNGAPGPGPLTIATRREALTRLMAIERGLGVQLIRPDEINQIAEFWAADGGNGNTAFDLMARSRRTERAPQDLCHAVFTRSFE